MAKKKIRLSVKDMRYSIAPTVGFRDYAVAKKPSIRNQAKQIINKVVSCMDTAFEGTQSDSDWDWRGRTSEGRTFGLDERMRGEDFQVAFAQTMPEGASTDIYHRLGDPYLVFLVYRGIKDFIDTQVDTLINEGLAKQIRYELRPKSMRKKSLYMPGAVIDEDEVSEEKPFDPYEVIGIRHDAPQSTIKSRINQHLQAYHPDRVQDKKQKAEYAEKFRQVNKAKELIGTRQARLRFARKKMQLAKGSTLFDENIVAKWQSISDVMTVAYAAQKKCFDTLDEGQDYAEFIDHLLAVARSGKMAKPRQKPAVSQRYSSLLENPKPKANASQKNRLVLKTERLWERYCQSGKHDDLIKAYDALLEAKFKVTTYDHKRQVAAGLKQARSELKRHAK